ncbi:ATP-binding protein [Kallipyga massiliensis]|uniref:ATP-binding protein n=1 Tax=Kallipyga massiliensis TaxID=1472764 RepID=UPI0004ADC6DD|nr:ATP-binding protein [Kallipyga massiliensis]
METVSLVIPSDPMYVTTLRLVTASIAQKMGFDIEAVDDLRVCVSEAVNYLFPYNERIRVNFSEEDDRITIAILAQAPSEDSEESRLHRMIMESLLDGVEERKDGFVLTKGR